MAAGSEADDRPLHDRPLQIRKKAYLLAAQGLEAALNQWDLSIYYESKEDQDALENEIWAIAKRLRKQGDRA